MGKSIVILCTLDTKCDEVELLKEVILDRGHNVLMLDMSLGRDSRISGDITTEEIAAEMQVESEKIKDLLPALAPMESIDAPLPGCDLLQHEKLADETGASPFDRAAEEETVSSVQRLLERLPDRQRLILAMRYGIGYPKECTLEEIGRALGLSRERIRQIEKVAREQFENNWGIGAKSIT